LECEGSLILAGKIKFPRRQFSRFIVKMLTKITLRLFTKLTIVGKENIPLEGPLIVVGNHFHFADPVAMIRILPTCTEFFSGANPAFAPMWAKKLPMLWGVLYVFRGKGSMKAFRSAEHLLSQNGILGIFPEAGSWAQVLRPPRPGSAYMAARTGASILPVGIYGFEKLFPLRLWNKPLVTIKVGIPYTPVNGVEKDQLKRDQLDIIGNEMMMKIAELLPCKQRGCYSEDPDLRAAAKTVSKYPWGNGEQND